MKWDLRKPLISLVKSSLVFVLFGCCLFSTITFFGKAKQYYGVMDSFVHRRTYHIKVCEDRIYMPEISN